MRFFHKRSIWFLLLTLALIIGLIGTSQPITQAASLLTESFEAPITTGNLNGQNGWTAVNSIMQVIDNTSPDYVPLSYNIPDGATIDGGSQQLRQLDPENDGALAKQLPSTQSGDLYIGYLFRANDVGTNTFAVFCLGASSGCTINTIPTFGVRHNAGQLQWLVRNQAFGSESYVTTPVSPGQTYYVVVKVSKDPGPDYDRIDMWINPERADFGTNGDAFTTLTSTISDLDYLSYRTALSNGTSVNILIDEITVGTTWDDVLPPGADYTLTESGGSTNVTEGGATDSYDLVLDYIPLGDVDVAITSDAQCEVNGQGASGTDTLTFTMANWDTPQTVTVTAIDDDLDEAATHLCTLGHVFSSVADAQYDALPNFDVNVTVTDDDTAAITNSDGDNALALDEATLTSDTYSFVLESEPASDVVITVDPDAECNVDGVTSDVSIDLTFTAGNWNTPQTVTVGSPDDDIDEGASVNCIITHAITTADPDYGALANPANMTVTITDDDTAGITNSDADFTLDLSEAGPLSTVYTFVLTSQPNGTPSNNVTITVDPGPQCAVNAAPLGDPINLVFNETTWLNPQVVTVSIVDDDLAQGGRTCAISHSTASDDANYDGLAPTAMTVNIADDDTPAINRVESGGTTAITEGSGPDTYTIVLNSQPTDSVAIDITPEATCDLGSGLGVAITENFGTASGPGGWDEVRTITVSVPDDLVDEDDRTCNLVHVITTIDPDYGAFSIADILVPITEDDTAGLAITETGGETQVQEGLYTDQYTVALTSEPQDTIEVTLTPDAQCDLGGGVGVAVLETFNNSDWNNARNLIVTANDDAASEGDHSCTITHVVSNAGTDAIYGAVTLPDLVVTVLDNDTPNVRITEAGGGTTVLENGAADFFSVVLDSPPSAAVTVNLDPEADCQLNGNGGDTDINLVFGTNLGTGGWNDIRTISVTAVNDEIDSGTRLCTILSTVTSGDGNYNNFAAADVVAQILEDDVSGITVTQSGGSTDVTEGGAADSYSIALTSQPTDTVVITVDPDANCLITGNDADLPIDFNFSPGNWNIPQAISVEAVDDALSEGPHTCTLTHTITSLDTTYAAKSIPNIVANITDNDTIEVTVTESDGITEMLEGEIDDYTLALGSQPSGDVTITATPSNAECDLGNGPGNAVTIDFAAASWDTPQTVTITGVDDLVSDGQQTCIISHTASGGGYDAAVIADVTATVSDNDGHAIVIAESGGQTEVAEGGATDTYTVVLGSPPTQDVTLTLMSDAQCSVDQPTLIFTPTGGVAGGWNMAQTVTVTAEDDANAEGTHACQIEHVATSGDANYNTLTAIVMASVIDNDLSGVCGVQSGIPTAQCEALETLYYQTGGDQWADATNWLATGVSPCDWFGVTCNGNQVVGLALPSNNLNGIFPTSLQAIPTLETIDLSGNPLTGPLASLDTLTNLQSLDVSGAQLAGEVPASYNAAIFPNLANLNLSYNQLYIVDPTTVAFVTTLDGDFLATQTVPPTALNVAGITQDSITIVWAPIPYSSGNGYYEIWYGVNGNTYSPHGTTADKAASTYTLDGLTADTTYYIQIVTVTTPSPEDPFGGTSRPSVSIMGTTGQAPPQNFAPVAVDDVYQAPINTAQISQTAPGILGNDTDANDDALTSLIVTAPQQGQLTLNADGSFVYKPNAGFVGVDTFTYRAFDGILPSANVGTVRFEIGTSTNNEQNNNNQTGNTDANGGSSSGGTGGTGGSGGTGSNGAGVLIIVIDVAMEPGLNPMTASGQVIQSTGSGATVLINPNQTIVPGIGWSGVSATVTADLGLNFRVLPAINSRRLAVLEFGARYPVIAQSQDGNWLQLNVGGELGWAYRYWLQLSASSNLVQTRGFLTGLVAYPNTNMRLRSGPSLENEIVGIQKEGRRVRVIGQSPDGLWLWVQYGVNQYAWTYKFNYRHADTLDPLPDVLPTIR